MAEKRTTKNLNQEIADGIASLVKGQRFAGSGVWHKGNVATLRVEAQTKEIVDLLKKRLPTAEDRREEARKEDREPTGAGGGSGEDIKPKKKGFFAGILSGFKGLFGFLGKLGKFFLGPVFKGIGTVLSTVFTGLKWLFKGLGFVALIGAGIAIGAFLSMDESKQKETIEAFKNFISKSWEFVKTLGEAFKGGFMSNMKDDKDTGVEGLETKFKNFQKAWGKAFEKINNIKFGPFKGLGDGKQYEGLAGIAHLIGDLFGKVAGIALDIGTGIGNLIADPNKFIGTLQGKIMALFDDLGALIADFWENGIANPRTWRNMLIGLLGPKAGAAAAATFGLGKEGIQEKETAKQQKLQERSSLIPGQIKEFEDHLADNTKKYTGAQRRFMSSEIVRLKSEKERVDKQIKHIEVLHQMDNAKEALEKKQQKILEEKGLDLEKLNKAATAAEELHKKRVSGREESLTGQEIMTREGQSQEFKVEAEGDKEREVTLVRKDVEELLEDQGFKESTLKEKSIGELLVILQKSFKGKKAGVVEHDIESILRWEGNLTPEQHMQQLQQIIDQQLKTEAGWEEELKAATKPLDDAMNELGKEKAQELLKLMKVTGKKAQEGGRITETGLTYLHAGETVFDPVASSKIDNFVASYLPQSGQQLNQLQMGRVGMNNAASSQPIVIDNSSQPQITNQTHVHIPAPQAEKLPGEQRTLFG